MISRNLIELAKIFHNTPLYVVGGYVRDFLLNINTTDVDITSSLTQNEVVRLLENTQFNTKIINKKLGTMLITIEDEKYEYTPFRKENYQLDGTHSPMDASFDATINEDAIRRDFTINSIYYNILEEKFVDLVGGMDDLKTLTLKTTKDADITFMEDSLRILRLARFSVVYNLAIDKSTLKSAKKNANLIKNLSRERVEEEYKKTIEKCDYDMMFNYIELLYNLGVIEALYGDIKGDFLYKTADGFINFCPTIETFYLAIIERFYYDFAPYSIDSFATILSAEKDIFSKVDSIIKNDKLPVKTAKYIKQLVSFMVLLYQFKNSTTLDILVSHYYNIITTIFSKPQNRMMVKNDIICQLAKYLDFSKPTTVQQLCVKFEDLQELGIKKQQTAQVLTILLEAVLLDKVENKKDKLLKYLEDVCLH